MTQTIPQQETALQVQSEPPVITFNFEAAKAAVQANLEKYNGLLVSEDTTVEIKKDMADLNKQKAALADAAKVAVKGITDPLDKFKGQVKELTSLFEKTYNSLGEKVKFFEDKQRDAKRVDIEGLIMEANLNAFGEPAFLNIPMQDKWLNKGTSLKSVKEDILAIVHRHIEAEVQKKALKQAGKDRAAAIEVHVNGQNAALGLKVPVSHYMTAAYLNIETPLQDVIAGITTSMEAAKELHAQQEAAKQPAPAPVPTLTPEPAQEQVQQVQPEIQPVTEPQRTISWSAPAQAAPATPSTTGTVSMIVCLEYSPANANSVTALLAALEKQCVSFSKRIKNQ